MNVTIESWDTVSDEIRETRNHDNRMAEQDAYDELVARYAAHGLTFENGMIGVPCLGSLSKLSKCDAESWFQYDPEDHDDLSPEKLVGTLCQDCEERDELLAYEPPPPSFDPGPDWEEALEGYDAELDLDLFGKVSA